MIVTAYDSCMSEGTAHGEALGYLVKHALQRLSMLADAALEPLGIDRKEFGVLRILAFSGPLSQQGVAAHAEIDPTTMVALIDSLESKGILTRKPDAADRRRNSIELTAAGSTRWTEAERAYADAEAEFLAPLSADEADRLRRALRKLLG